MVTDDIEEDEGLVDVLYFLRRAAAPFLLLQVAGAEEGQTGQDTPNDTLLFSAIFI